MVLADIDFAGISRDCACCGELTFGHARRSTASAGWSSCVRLSRPSRPTASRAHTAIVLAASIAHRLGIRCTASQPMWLSQRLVLYLSWVLSYLRSALVFHSRCEARLVPPPSFAHRALYPIFSNLVLFRLKHSRGSSYRLRPDPWVADI